MLSVIGVGVLFKSASCEKFAKSPNCKPCQSFPLYGSHCNSIGGTRQSIKNEMIHPRKLFTPPQKNFQLLKFG